MKAHVLPLFAHLSNRFRNTSELIDTSCVAEQQVTDAAALQLTNDTKDYMLHSCIAEADVLSIACDIYKQAAQLSFMYFDNLRYACICVICLYCSFSQLK